MALHWQPVVLLLLYLHSGVLINGSPVTTTKENRNDLNEFYRPQIWSVLNYLNANPERQYNYNAGYFLDSQKKSDDVTFLEIDVDAECLAYGECTDAVFSCKAFVEYFATTNKFETLPGVECQVKHDVPSVEDETPSKSDYCPGCTVELDTNVPGVENLIDTALQHLESERSNKHISVKVLRLQREIVSGVKFILLLEVAPFDQDASSEICRVEYIQKPWISNDKHIIANNCTASQEFAAISSKKQRNDFDNEIDVNNEYKKPAEIPDAIPESPNFDKMAETGNLEDVTDVKPARLLDIEAQIIPTDPTDGHPIVEATKYGMDSSQMGIEDVPSLPTSTDSFEGEERVTEAAKALQGELDRDTSHESDESIEGERTRRDADDSKNSMDSKSSEESAEVKTAVEEGNVVATEVVEAATQDEVLVRRKRSNKDDDDDDSSSSSSSDDDDDKDKKRKTKKYRKKVSCKKQDDNDDDDDDDDDCPNKKSKAKKSKCNDDDDDDDNDCPKKNTKTQCNDNDDDDKNDCPKAVKKSKCDDDDDDDDDDDEDDDCPNKKKSSKKNKKDSSSSSSSSSSSDDDNKRRRRNLHEDVLAEEELVNKLAQFAGESMDDSTYKHELLEVLRVKKLELEGAVYHMVLRFATTKCNEIGACYPSGEDKLCKVQLHLAKDHKMKLLKSRCHKIEREADKNRSKRGIPGAPVDAANDQTIKDLAKSTLLQLDSESPHQNKYKVVHIHEASKQVVSGMLYKIKCDIILSDCPKTADKDSELCGESKEGVKKTCHITVWDQPWLPNGKQTNVTCGEENFTYRAKRSLPDLYSDKFDLFMQTYQKTYSEREREYRFGVFKDNMRKAEMLQKNEQGSATYGASKFADLDEIEFKQYLGLRPELNVENAIPYGMAMIPEIDVPTEFDWRSKGAVTHVKDQGQCGSCWAFSVTGNVEGQYAIKHSNLLELSEQELVDCDKMDEGCNGGYMTNAYRAIEQLGGLETESDYPYDAEDEKCKYKQSKSRVQLSGAVNISQNEDDMVKWLVKNGPISIGINANAMQLYMGGVSHPLKFLCNPTDLDHGVLVVGYGVHTYKLFNKTLPYWIVKNSWGPSWGEQGYYRVYRGDGTCGVNKMASSAIVD